MVAQPSSRPSCSLEKMRVEPAVPCPRPNGPAHSKPQTKARPTSLVERANKDLRGLSASTAADRRSDQGRCLLYSLFRWNRLRTGSARSNRRCSLDQSPDGNDTGNPKGRHNQHSRNWHPGRQSRHSSCTRTGPGYLPGQLENLPGSPTPPLASACLRRTRRPCSRCPPAQTCSEAPCSKSTAAQKPSGRGLLASARCNVAQSASPQAVLGFSSPALAAVQHAPLAFHAAGTHRSGAAEPDRSDVFEIQAVLAGSHDYSAQPAAVAEPDSADAWPAFQPAAEPVAVAAAVVVAVAGTDSVAVWPAFQPAAEPVAVTAAVVVVAGTDSAAVWPAFQPAAE